MPHPYTGKLLRVNLTTQHWKVDTISEDLVRDYLLGSGLAARLFYDELDPRLDPLDPANPLIFMTGLLTGTAAPTSCRLSVCGRSPLTGIWNESLVGGYFGAELRFAGYDGLVVTGRADRPVYVWINDDKVEIRPAEALWGLDTYATAERLQEETDPKAQVSCIGPAGEKLNRIAAIMFGGHDARAAGRGGMGALMGSRKLKAVVVRGRRRPGYHDRKGFLGYVREINPWIKENSLGLSNFGTAGGVPATELYGDLPIKNWLLGNWKEGAAKTSGQRMADTILTGHYRCFGCPIACGMEIAIEEGPYAGLKGHGPEYETLAMMGALCLNDDLHAIARMNDLCNRQGLDTISTGAVLAFAMEARERGLLGQDDLDGIDLSWGNAAAMIELVEKMARREGCGRWLADGVKRAAERLGPESRELAVETKGLEIPAHDPRAFVSMAANYATANRGGCHLEALSYWNGYGIPLPDLGYPEPLDYHSSEGAGRMAYDFQNYLSVINPLGLCKFAVKASLGPETVARLVNLALGWDWEAADVMRMGEKLFNLKRMINVRYGITGHDDTLPQRLLAHARPSGQAEGVLPDLPRMLREYYELRGWTEAGIPTEEKLAELGL